MNFKKYKNIFLASFLDNKRTINLLNQIKLSFVLKISSVFFSLIIVRLLLQYLGVKEYGVWAVILTFLNWIVFFDLGIANGVKNKVSQSLASNNNKLAREYIATGYISVAVIVFFFYIIFYFFAQIINWQSVFRVVSVEEIVLKRVLLIIVFFALFNFVLSLINQIATAVQKASYVALNQFLSQFFALLCVVLLVNYYSKNLVLLSFSYGISLILSNIIVSFFFFKKHSELRPTFNCFKKDKVKEIVSLGLRFFFLQLIMLAILSVDRILVAQFCGASIVASYDILYKYFSVLLIIHGIVNMPLWSVYTESYLKGDYNWIKNTLHKMRLLMIFYIVVVVVMISISSKIFHLWLGTSDIDLNISNIILMGLLMLSLIWYQTYACFSNGIEKTKGQLIAGSAGAILHVPLAWLFVSKLELGLNGILLATFCSLLIYGIIGPLEAFKILKN